MRSASTPLFDVGAEVGQLTIGRRALSDVNGRTLSATPQGRPKSATTQPTKSLVPMPTPSALPPSTGIPKAQDGSGGEELSEADGLSAKKTPKMWAPKTDDADDYCHHTIRSTSLASAESSSTPQAFVGLSADDTTTIRMCGWLTKEGHVVRNWKRRWFVLRGTDVAYYRKQTDLVPIKVSR